MHGHEGVGHPGVDLGGGFDQAVVHLSHGSSAILYFYIYNSRAAVKFSISEKKIIKFESKDT